MTFEQALSAMRNGMKVKRPNQLSLRTMKDGFIYEVYKTDKGIWKYCRMDSMNCCNIEADDWEIINE